MKVVKHILLYIFIVLFAFSCKKTTNIQDFKSEEINGINYKLTMISKDFFENDSVKNIADLLYFKMEIEESNGKRDKISKLYLQENYNSLLYYINQNISNDFILENGTEQKGPIQVFYESNHRLVNKIVFLIAFEKPQSLDSEFSVIYNDNIFNAGKLKFKYNN